MREPPVQEDHQRIGMVADHAKRLFVAACSILLFAGAAVSVAGTAVGRGDDVRAFQYRAAQWPKDTALVYRETQIGIDRQDSLTTLYMDEKGNLEALKLLRTAPRTLLVKARFDWAISSVVHYESWNLPMRSGDQPSAVADFDLARRTLMIEARGVGSKRLHVASVPFHVHDFELMSLGVAMRFLKSPESPFTFELIGLDRKDRIFFKDSGPILVEYDGPESCRGEVTKPCREYVLLWAKSRRYFGRMQIDAQTGDLVLVETVVPDEPGIVSLRLQLLGSRVMTPVQWRQTLEQAPANPMYLRAARPARHE